MQQTPSNGLQQGAVPIELTRRSLLRVGVLGGLALGTAGLGASLSGCTGRSEAAASGYAVLRDADIIFLRALVPVVLDGQMSAEPARIDSIIRGIDVSLHLVGLPSRKAFTQLLDILNMSLTRRFVAGVPVPWDQATPDQVRGFLSKWHNSAIATLNAGYRALIKLPPAVFYSTHEGWPLAGYPGPPAAQFAALNS